MERILVIDDDTLILRLLCTFLEGSGYKVEITNSGSDGLVMFDNGYDFDLVITDINMPGIDGNDVARHIRESEKAATPIIAITGLQESELQGDFFDSILVKPFKLEAMAGTIRSLL